MTEEQWAKERATVLEEPPYEPRLGDCREELISLQPRRRLQLRSRQDLHASKQIEAGLRAVHRARSSRRDSWNFFG
jgi:hypothetical protein